MSTIVDVHLLRDGFGKYFSLREDARGRVVLLSFDKDRMQRFDGTDNCPWKDVDFDMSLAHLAAQVSEDLVHGFSVTHVSIQSDFRDLTEIADSLVSTVEPPRVLSWRCSRRH